jgi:hypothetical protein
MPEVLSSFFLTLAIVAGYLVRPDGHSQGRPMSKEPPRRRGNRRIQLFNEIADELNFYEWHMGAQQKITM